MKKSTKKLLGVTAVAVAGLLACSLLRDASDRAKAERRSTNA